MSAHSLASALPLAAEHALAAACAVRLVVGEGGEHRCEAQLRVVPSAAPADTPADTPAVQARNHAATGGNRELAP